LIQATNLGKFSQLNAHNILFRAFILETLASQDRADETAGQVWDLVSENLVKAPEVADSH
jgi:hypothetical protein